MSVSIDKLYRAALASDLSYVEFGDWPQLPDPDVLISGMETAADLTLPSGLRYTQRQRQQIASEFQLLRFMQGGTGLDAGLFRHVPTGELYLGVRGLQTDTATPADYAELSVNNILVVGSTQVDDLARFLRALVTEGLASESNRVVLAGNNLGGAVAAQLLEEISWDTHQLSFALRRISWDTHQLSFALRPGASPSRLHRVFPAVRLARVSSACLPSCRISAASQESPGTSHQRFG